MDSLKVTQPSVENRAMINPCVHTLARRIPRPDDFEPLSEEAHPSLSRTDSKRTDVSCCNHLCRYDRVVLKAERRNAFLVVGLEVNR
jgi:hypothetical protein